MGRGPAVTIRGRDALIILRFISGEIVASNVFRSGCKAARFLSPEWSSDCTLQGLCHGSLLPETPPLGKGAQTSPSPQTFAPRPM